jgi:hypothetical protein
MAGGGLIRLAYNAFESRIISFITLRLFFLFFLFLASIPLTIASKP